MRNFCFVLLISLFAGLSSCNVTRHVPAGHYLLMKNEIEVGKEKELPRSEQITSSALEPYIRQKPVSSFLGLNAPVWIYNQADPSSKTWWNRTKRNIGKEPVILDTTLTRRSADNMKIFMDGKGFLDSRAHYVVDTASRKAKVTYEITQGAPYRIGKISYDFRDEFLRPLIQGDSLSTLLKTGNVFDVNVLDDERKRITDFLKNRGYYKFNVNNIIYGRSPSVENTIDIRVIVKQDMAGYDEEGNEIMDNNSVYRFRDIYIYISELRPYGCVFRSPLPEPS